MTSDPMLYSRRQVLSLGRKALIVVGVGCLYPVSRYLTAKENPLAVARIASNKMPLSLHWQQLGQTRFWLRQGSNGVEAMWASCTHLGCEVSYNLEKDQWICPCHGSRYSKDGLPLVGPAVRPLVRAKVNEKDGFYLLQQPSV